MNKAVNLRDTKKLLQLATGCIFFILFASAGNLMAQTRGKLEVVKDPLVDTLAARRLRGLAGGGAGAAAFSSNGYRVQIFTGTNRTDAFNAQNKFQRLYPDIRTYITYREPNFKVRVGDFRTRMEASKMMAQLRSAFPVLFIISEKINPPKLDAQ